MQIQVNSDNHIQSSKRLEEWVRTTIESTLDRYEEDLTRVEVHLSDENGDKPGPHDLRCQLEARPKGHQPISVTHKADSLEQAIDGAAENWNMRWSTCLANCGANPAPPSCHSARRMTHCWKKSFWRTNRQRSTVDALILQATP